MEAVAPCSQEIVENEIASIGQIDQRSLGFTLSVIHSSMDFDKCTAVCISP